MKGIALAALMAVTMGHVAVLPHDQTGSDVPHGMRIEDTFAIRDIGEIALSPDGTTVIFTVSSTDLSANRILGRVMTVATTGGEPQPLEGWPDGVSQLSWSPDGMHVALFGSRDGQTSIWTWNVRTRALTRVCSYQRSNSFLPQTGDWLSWSPDSQTLAYAGTNEPPPRSGGPVVVDRIRYKSRTAFSDNRRAHLFVVPASGGTPRQITTGHFDEHSIDWHPDGREIVFVSNHEADPDAVHNYDIFAVNVSTMAVRQITATPGVEMTPRISPDGQSIAYLATTRRVTTIDSVAEDAHVWIVPFTGGRGRELSGTFDRRAQSIAWAADGKTIVFTAGDRGKTLLYRIAREGGTATPILDLRGQFGPFATSANGTIVAGLSTPDAPREIHRIDPGASSAAPLTTLNRDLVRGWRLSKPETVHFTSRDGTAVEGFFYPPLDLHGRAPMVLNVHGGPHGMFGYAFDPTAQVYAARGYALLQINPRGSTGYGQKFSDGTLDNWGGGDYQDLMAGVDHVLSTRSDVDANRLGVTGRSYGGFMTNWVITQTDRFKAAVSIASVANLVSFYGTSLYQDLIHAEFGGMPWEGDNFARLWKWSPLAYVVRVKTPTLFIHGEQDNDVHVTEPEAMYMALRRQGVESVFARYPREGHRFREPQHNADAFGRALEWMDRFLMTAPEKSAGNQRK